MKDKKKFADTVKLAWEAIKNTCHPEYHPELRNVMFRLIAAEDTEFHEFVDLMVISGWDPHAAIFCVATAAEKPQRARGNKEMKKSKNREKINKALDEKINKELDEAAEEAADNEPALHQCHYCGDMYHVSELTGAKMGLICYKCRHEMENRD